MLPENVTRKYGLDMSWKGTWLDKVWLQLETGRNTESNSLISLDGVSWNDQQDFE